MKKSKRIIKNVLLLGAVSALSITAFNFRDNIKEKFDSVVDKIHDKFDKDNLNEDFDKNSILIQEFNTMPTSIIMDLPTQEQIKESQLIKPTLNTSALISSKYVIKSDFTNSDSKVKWALKYSSSQNDYNSKDREIMLNVSADTKTATITYLKPCNDTIDLIATLEDDETQTKITKLESLTRQTHADIKINDFYYSESKLDKYQTLYVNEPLTFDFENADSILTSFDLEVLDYISLGSYGKLDSNFNYVQISYSLSKEFTNFLQLKNYKPFGCMSFEDSISMYEDNSTLCTNYIDLGLHVNDTNFLKFDNGSSNKLNFIIGCENEIFCCDEDNTSYLNLKALIEEYNLTEHKEGALNVYLSYAMYKGNELNNSNVSINIDNNNRISVADKEKLYFDVITLNFEIETE